MTQPPVSQFSQEKYIMNEGVVKPLKTRVDVTRTPYDRTAGRNVSQDFTRYSKRNVMDSAPTSRKVFIEPLAQREKSGPKFGSSLPKIEGGV